MARSSILVCALVAAAAAGASYVDATGHHDHTKSDMKSSKSTLKDHAKSAKKHMKAYKKAQKDAVKAGTITKDQMKANEKEVKGYYKEAKKDYKHGIKSWSKHVGEDVYSAPFAEGRDEFRAGDVAGKKLKEMIGWTDPWVPINPFYN